MIVQTELKQSWVVWLRALWSAAMMAVTVLALLPVDQLPLPGLDLWDKAQHTLAFLVLTLWALLLWPRAVWHVLLGMLAFGAGIELAQWAVGWRFAEWADLTADALGVVAAFVIARSLSSSIACK